MDQEPNNLNLNILEEEEEEEDENVEENLAYLQDRQEEEEGDEGKNENEEREGTHTKDGNEEIRWETPNRYSFVNYEYLQNVAEVQYSQNGKLSSIVEKLGPY